MTNEEKLKRLLEVAVENGWKTTDSIISLWLHNEGYAPILKNKIELLRGNYSLSLNDLVTNFEEGELSFIDALCKLPFHVVSDEYKSKGANDIYVPKDRFINEWHSTPTSERLNVLFNTFNHLL